jgi:putative DNA primase/helicase
MSKKRRKKPHTESRLIQTGKAVLPGREGEKQATSCNERVMIPDELISFALENGERGDGELLAFLLRDQFVYDVAEHAWYWWADGHWQLDTHDNIFVAVDRLVQLYRLVAAKYKKMEFQDEDGRAKKLKGIASKIQDLQQVRYRKNVLRFAAAGKDGLGILNTLWDQDSMLIGCPNGVLNLRSGKLSIGRPEQYIRSIIPTPYEGLNASCPQWEKFLYEIFGGEKEIVDFVQRLFGYALTGSCNEHIFVILSGQGRNGKSTLLEVMRAVLGGQLTGAIPGEMLLSRTVGNSSAGPRADIMHLRGKRIVWASETNEGKSFDISAVKYFVGGDTLSGRSPYGKQQLNFQPTHTLFLSTNHRPKATTDDYAFWQRVVTIEFSFSFVKEPVKEYERQANPRIREILLQEAAEILSWLVRGCIAYVQEGQLRLPEVVKTATKRYQEAEDTLSEFIHSCCVLGEQYLGQAATIYNVYKEWCQNNGYEPMTMKQFGGKMRKRFTVKIGAYIHYIGIAVNPAWDRVKTP